MQKNRKTDNPVNWGNGWRDALSSKGLGLLFISLKN